MNVRRITAAQIPAVLPLVEQYWIFEDIQGFHEAAIRRELERVCADPRLGAGWIAEDGGGVAMLDAAEAEFRRMGCTNVSLQLGRGNDAAREFYRRRGYSERSGYELLDKMLRQ